MLSMFPELYDWSWFVPFFFRMFLAWYFITSGYTLARAGDNGGENERFAWTILGAIITAVGGAFLAGIFVQVAGATGFVLAIFAIVLKHTAREEARRVVESQIFYLLLGLVSLSLVFLGPGPWAIDLPL